MRRVSLALVVGLGVATVALYWSELPWVSEIPGWFYRYRDKGITVRVLGAVGLVVSMLLALAAVARVRTGTRRGRAAAVGLLVIACAGLQLGASAIGKDDAFFKRHESGHGKYWRVTAERRGEWLETLLEFERLAPARQLGDFAPSKPPGVLLPYMAVDSLARAPALSDVLAPIAEQAERRPRLAGYGSTVALSIFLLPLITALVIPAMLLLGRALFADDAIAWGGAVLFTTVPATLLIQYHLDGAVYPLIAVLACALAATGARGDRLWATALAGVVAMLGLYVSFSLLAALPLVVGCVLAVGYDRACAAERPTAELVRGIATQLFLIAVFASATFLALRFFLRFDPLVRYEAAMEYHARWKRAVPTELWRRAALVEYALYVGVPLVAVWLTRVLRGAVRIVPFRLDTRDLTTVGLFVLLLLVSAKSGTNEVSRMWMLLNPFLALSAATALRPLALRDRSGDGWKVPLAVLASTQLVVALFMKAFQEW